VIGCYPYQDKEPFLIEETPHVYFAGNQPRYETTIIEGPVGQTVRLIAVPNFKVTGEVILLDMDTLESEVVKIDVYSG
jgi:DNA polymerase delta subunit 2